MAFEKPTSGTNSEPSRVTSFWKAEPTRLNTPRAATQLRVPPPRVSRTESLPITARLSRQIRAQPSVAGTFCCAQESTRGRPRRIVYPNKRRKVISHEVLLHLLAWLFCASTALQASYGPPKTTCFGRQASCPRRPRRHLSRQIEPTKDIRIGAHIGWCCRSCPGCDAEKR